MNLWGIIKGLLIQDSTDRSKELSVEVSPAATAGTRTTLSSAQTANRTLALPDESGSLISNVTTDALDARLDTAEADIDQAQADIVALDARADADEAALAAHIADPTAAHAASAISAIPTGIYSSNNVQDQLNETDFYVQDLRVDLDDHIADSSNAHAASAIGVTPSGNLSSTTVQAALQELQTDIDTLAPGGGANTALSNLAPTAINQSLMPDTNNVYILGNSFFRWQSATISQVNSNYLLLGGAGANIQPYGLNSIILQSDLNATANANPTGDISIVTGNKTGGTGNSGSIILQIGTSVGGTRGKIKMQDGTQGTVGHVWTESAVDGTGSWQALPAQPNNSGLSASIEYSVAATGTPVDVTNATVTITGTGRPVMIMLVADITTATSGAPSQIGVSNGSTNIAYITFNCMRNVSTNVGSLGLQANGPASTSGIGKAIPSSSLCFIDPAPPVGSNTYKLTVNGRLGTHTAFVNASKLYVREL